MSSSNDANRRYMKLFVYLPVALHPQPRKALLVCFGVGDTAKALTGTASLTKIDIVDISRDVLDLSSVVFPESRDNPLHDPRVRVHIEDGRFFLQTTRETYDLITGEPPPPFLAGVVNLYTREYFELLRSRLAPGGFVTYWLPLHGISRRDAFSITRAFCDVFEDCSLWNGDFTNWVLLGSNGAGQPAGDPGRQWADPAVLPSLKALSFESPELLGATFLADAETLREETRDALPVVDEFPKRLSGKPEEGDAAELASLGDTLLASRRFARSAFVGRIFPPPLRERTIDAFRLQFIVVSALKGPQGRTPLAVLRDLDLVLTQTSLETPVLWMLGTDARSVEIARGVEGQGKNDAAVQEILAADDLSRRRYLEAERRYASLKGAGGFVQELRVVLLCLGGERGKAAALARELGALAPRYVFGEEFPRWCESRYGLSPTGS